MNLQPQPTGDGVTEYDPRLHPPVYRRHRLFSRTVLTEFGVMECRDPWYRRIFLFLTGR